MGNEDQEYLRERGESALKAGLSAVKARNHGEARDLLRVALAKLERSHGRKDPAFAECLGALGDTQYALSDYAEAALSYNQLIITGQAENDQQLVNWWFKLANCYDKSKRTSEADSAYRQALLICESKFSPGEPIAISIMEGFAAMLRRGNLISEEAGKLEEKAKEWRARAKHPTRITQNMLKAASNSFNKLKSSVAHGQGGQRSLEASSTLNRLESLNPADSLTAEPLLRKTYRQGVPTFNRLQAMEFEGGPLTESSATTTTTPTPAKVSTASKNRNAADSSPQVSKISPALRESAAFAGQARSTRAIMRVVFCLIILAIVLFVGYWLGTQHRG